MIFMFNCIRCFRTFAFLFLKNIQSGIRIDANSVFMFLIFLWMPLKNTGPMMKKTWKSGFSRFLVVFHHLKNASWTSRPGSRNRFLSVTLRTWKIKKTPNDEKRVFSICTWERSQKHDFFKFFPSFFQHSKSGESCTSQSSYGDPCSFRSILL